MSWIKVFHNKCYIGLSGSNVSFLGNVTINLENHQMTSIVPYGLPLTQQCPRYFYHHPFPSLLPLTQWFSAESDSAIPGLFGNVWGQFWLSIGAYWWHPVGRAQGCCKNLLQYTGQSPQGIIQSNMSVMPRSRNLGLRDICFCCCVSRHLGYLLHWGN